MVNEKSSAVGVNIQEKATMIWNVADVLRGPFKPHEYGLVILPMTVVNRFHDCLLPTHDAVIEQYCDIDGGCDFDTAEELVQAKIFNGKSLKDRWSCVVICSIEGLSYEDWLEYFEHEPVNPQSDEIIE